MGSNYLAGQAAVAVQAGSVSGGIHLHHRASASHAVPRQLPAFPRHWVDRGDVLAALNQRASRRGPVVVAVSGVSGVGKTALAVYWLRRHLRRTFPGGELYADLAASGDPGEVLGCWLRALGCVVPASPPARAVAFRTATATKPVAVLIDNATYSEQVRPLLTSSPSSVTVVTSRSPLPDLVNEGAVLQHLGPLDADSSRKLFRAHAAEYGTAVEPGAESVLVEACGGLPLAVGLASAHLAMPCPGRRDLAINPRPRSSLSRAVREVITMSYEALPESARLLYRLIGDHPSGEIIRPAAAAMLDTDPEEAAEAIDWLLQARLLEENDHGFKIPSRVHEHARSLVSGDDEAVRAAARGRVVLSYLETAMDADWVLNPHPRRYSLAYRDLRTGTRTPTFATKDEAMAWFDVVRGTLPKLQHRAHEDGDHTTVWQLAEAAWAGCLKGGHTKLLVDMHELGCQAARHCQHPAESILRSRLSRGYRSLGRLQEALEVAVEARSLAATTEDVWAESAALSAQGRVHYDLADYMEALQCFQLSLNLAARVAESRSIALRLRHIGECYAALKRNEDACAAYTAAAARMDGLGDREGYAATLTKLAAVRLAQGQVTSALDHLHVALPIMRASGSPIYTAKVLAQLGHAALRRGDRHQARSYNHEAHQLFRRAGDTRNAEDMSASLTTLQ
ncbi:hypothetical protein GCM10011581_48390 [Saccharopolyspora subtropica]|uniref:Tetratricopeptide repeat protein n=1 Tax=Saccharopolyspora thermophila TaxID=89367 RepID=A0A917NL23_9PSEU|nr:tetratricopeptide repeat protein [Saccharopolyspora subtropica]GGJ05637.1 hypothetical protein GCM10011581_48390 [Saccharopolyspora subtropica]